MKNHLLVIYGLIIILAIWMFQMKTIQNAHIKKTVDLYNYLNKADSVALIYVRENTDRWERQYRLDSSIYIKLKTLYDIENSRK